MPRGFHKDRTATEAAHFADPRSFISLPKIIKDECTEAKPHLVLYGEEDIHRARIEVFRRNRAENGILSEGIAQCWKCHRLLLEYADDLDPLRAHWHHLRNKPGTRCDCPDNSAVSCAACHRPEHPQTQFGRHGKIL